jgi:hypothetical protein
VYRITRRHETEASHVHRRRHENLTLRTAELMNLRRNLKYVYLTSMGMEIATFVEYEAM